MSKSITISNLESWFEDLAFVKQNNNAPFVSTESIQEFVVEYAVDHDWPLKRCARVLVAAKDMGLIEEGVWYEHQEVLATGATYDLRMVMALAKAEKQLTNGSLIKYPKYVGVVRENRPKGNEIESSLPYPDNVSYVLAESELGIIRAKRYLETYVSGHIRNRLAILAANDEDVEKAAKNLKVKIDKIVKEFI